MISRLKEFRVEGLFDLYSHTIPLNIDENITAVIGPNGRGKTVCLKLIEALFSRNFGYFLNIPFSRVEYSFSKGEIVSIENVLSTNPPADTSAAQRQGQDGRTMQMEFRTADGKRQRWVPLQLAVTHRIFRELSRYLPFLERTGLDEWIDRRDGEELSFQEIIERYGRRLPTRLRTALQSNEPAEFRDLVDRIDCNLIETQRLLVLRSSEIEDIEDDLIVYHHRGRPRTGSSRLAVNQKAEKLKNILQATLAEYATLSQSLDRSFPRRVFEAKGAVALTGSELQDQLTILDKRRRALMAAGILDTEFEPVAFARGNIEPGVAKVLEIYVHDTTRKLDVFERIFSRIDALKELTQSRFIDKSLQIDREIGLRIISKTGNEVPLDKLSSGEQHQLILLFDLLFEVNENSLILIDEPELSLHITWQKSFVDSLKRIISLNSFDVIVATHSPPLVARHYNLTVELGPVDETPGDMS